MNRGEAHVSGRWRIAPLQFKVVKEIQHLLGTEVLKIQISHRPPSLCSYELQQQHEGITVALYSLRTGSTYLWEGLRTRATLLST